MLLSKLLNYLDSMIVKIIIKNENNYHFQFLILKIIFMAINSRVITKYEMGINLFHLLWSLTVSCIAYDEDVFTLENI